MTTSFCYRSLALLLALLSQLISQSACADVVAKDAAKQVTAPSTPASYRALDTPQAIDFSRFTTISIAPTPAWVLPQATPTTAEQSAISATTAKYAGFFLLSDFQYLAPAAADEQQFRHFVIKLNNPNGARNYQTLNFVYNPGFEKLQLHNVTIQRGGKHIDGLAQAKYRIVRNNHDSDIIDGELRLQLLLQGLQPGDEVDYAYTVVGQNPVFGEHFYHHRPLSWNLPVVHQFMRIVWQRHTPLFHQIMAAPYQFSSQPANGGQVLELSIPFSARTLNAPKQAARAEVRMSDVNEWANVAIWGRQLFEGALQPNAQISQKAAQLAQGRKTQTAKAVAAIDFVQTQIRYLALEIGINSHRPTAPSFTLAHRFGDCKDKVALLIALLNAMHISAYPVLVNTDNGTHLANELPSVKAFNHAIIMLVLEDKQYFIDPTIGVQKGDITARQAPFYGDVLILRQGEQQLHTMPDQSGASAITYHELYDLTQGAGQPVKYQWQANYHGQAAEDMRQQLVAGKSAVAAALVKQLNQLYTSAQLTGPESVARVNVTDNEQGVAVKLPLQLSNLWQQDRTGDQRFFAFEHLIGSKLTGVSSTQLQQSYPLQIDGTITLKLNEAKVWAFTAEQHQQRNAWFDFRYQVQFDQTSNQLQLKYHLQTLRRFVAQSELAAYQSAVNAIQDWRSYGIVSYADAEHAQTWWQRYAWFWLLAIIAVTALLGLFCYKKLVHEPTK